MLLTLVLSWKFQSDTSYKTFNLIVAPNFHHQFVDTILITFSSCFSHFFIKRIVFWQNKISINRNGLDQMSVSLISVSIWFDYFSFLIIRCIITSALFIRISIYRSMIKTCNRLLLLFLVFASSNHSLFNKLSFISFNLIIEFQVVYVKRKN